MNLIKELKDLKEEIRAAGSASAKAKAMKHIDKLIDEECEKIREERKKIAEQNQVQRDIEHRRIKMAAEGRFYRRHERR